MTEMFKWLRANRVCIVYNDVTKENVGTFETEAGAERECERLNLQAWQEARPVTSMDTPSMVWGDDWEGRLLAILDRPYELELRAAA